jgi:hypothetical protein
MPTFFPDPRHEQLIVDFPCALDNLTNALPPRHQYTADALIGSHTILPHYGPFMPPTRLVEIRALIKADSGKPISPKIEILTFTVHSSDFLRTCSCCAKADCEK